MKRHRARKRQMEACKRKADREDRDRAYLVFFQYLIVGFWYARSHKVPPLVTSRLRRLSDVILREICKLRNLDVPERPPRGNLQENFTASEASGLLCCLTFITSFNC